MAWHIVAFAFLSYSATVVRCQSAAFIFPPNSANTNFSQTAPIVAKIGSVHWNDDIVIEYTVPDTVKAVWLSQQCYGNINDTLQGSNGGTSPSSSSSQCKPLYIINKSTTIADQRNSRQRNHRRNDIQSGKWHRLWRLPELLLLCNI
jgi:hypothetical protein